MSARVARKRARTDTEDGMAGTENGQGSIRESEAPDDAQKVLKTDADFWFEDGTVILIARDVEFRVYSGLLTSQSTVFQDLLAQPQPVRAVTIHGVEKIPCPILHLSDSPEELRHLLNVCAPYWDNKVSWWDEMTPTFEEVYSFIRLGKKYKMTAVYEQPLRFLKEFYTSDFNSWINSSPNWVPDGWDNAAAIGVVNLARLSEENLILPLALLACTTLGEGVAKGFTREDGSQETLTPEDLGLCFAAQTEIRKESLSSLLRTLTYAPQCQDPGPCRAALHGALVGLRDCVDDIIEGDPFSSYLVYLEDGKIDVCSACKAALKSLNWEERVKMWNTLPEIMGVDVPDWVPEAHDVQ